MGRFIFKSMLLGLTSVLMASSLYAEDALVDDNTDGTNANEFEAYWYYYDDNSGTKDDDRPQAGPSTTASVIDVEYIEKPRHAFGNESDTWPVKDYTFTLGTEAGNTFATMPFTYGEIWEASYGDATPYVGIGTMLALDGKSIDLTGATGVSFKIRSHTEALSIDFKVETMDITEDSSFAYYQIPVAVTTEWSVQEVLFADLEQPGWVKGPDEKDFDITQVTKLAWEVAGGKNKTITSDGIDVDDIKILNYTFISPSVKQETTTMGQIDGLFSTFEESTPQSTPLNTYWYAYDDHEIGGTSSVTRGATKNTTTGLLNLEWVDGSGSDGVGKAAFLEMELGPTIKQPKLDGTFSDVQGFVGIGFNVYDSATSTYFDATTGKRGTKGGTGAATGVYFEYLADGDFKYMTLEVSDMNDVGDSITPTRKDGRGSGIVWYRNFLKTGADVWKAVYIPFSELIIHDDWVDYKDIPLDLTKLAKIQFKVQGAEGQSGLLMIDNVCLPGVDFGVGVNKSLTRSVRGNAFNAAYSHGNIMVNWNNGARFTNGKISIVNTKGAVVKAVAAPSNALSASISAGTLPAGMYFVKLNGINASGKSVARQSAITIVK